MNELSNIHTQLLKLRVRRLTEKELDKEEKKERARELSGVMGRYSHICTFLAGIFFTCILLVLQQKEKFDYEVGIAAFRIRVLEMVSVPLTTTFLLFVFDAFYLCDSLTISRAR